MAKINVRGVLLGGVAAGLVIFAINGVVNGLILNGGFQTWALGMGSLIHPAPRPTAMLLWTLMCLLYGIVGVWIYAGMRPRYGAGPGTALLAGLLLWIAGKLTVALDFTALGLLPAGLVAGQLIGGFVALMLGVTCGAWLYRE
jgi:hypothetical protein